MLLYNAPEPENYESYQQRGSIGFSDVAGAQIDTFMYENLSNSRERNIDAEIWKEVHKVHGLAPELFGPKSVPQTHPNAPKILQQAWNETAQLQDNIRKSDWEGFIEPNLKELKERFPDANIRDLNEIDDDIAKQAAEYRNTFNEMYEYSDPYAGFFGMMGGSVAAAMADPINIMTLPLGTGRVVAGGFLRSLATVVGKNFVIGAAIEGSIQPFVMDYKKEIESPYDLQEALLAIASGGIGMGLLNGAGHTIGRAFRKFNGIPNEKIPDSYERRAEIKQLKESFEALEILQNFVDESGAKTVGQIEIHLKALAETMEDVNAGRQIDYNKLGETIEREYMELFDGEINGARSAMDFIAQERHRLEQEFNPEIHAKQEQLKKFADQKLSPLELKRAAAKASPESAPTGELNQATDLDVIREIQKADYDRTIGEDTVRQNEEANIANNELTASRRDEGDMIDIKAQIDDLDAQYDRKVLYHAGAKDARKQYLIDKTEEANTAILTAPTDTPRMVQVKGAINRILAALGAENDITVKVHEGVPEVEGDMRYSRVGDDDVSANSVLQFTPFETAQKLAKAYAKKYGIKYTPPKKHVVANPARGALIADEFARMKHDPSNKEVAAAYEAMINETIEQFRYIVDSGLKIEFIRGDDPYVNGPSDVIADVRDNNHMWIFGTRDGFGSNDKFDPVDNPLLAETEFEIDGVKMLANDVFRVVHDYFGHVSTGTTFRATGEENAWQSHAAMYTPLARRAMTTETRGQNSWVNYGPDGTINRTATTGETTFADQKIGLLPRWVSEENRVSADDRKIRYESDRRNNTTGYEGAIDESGRIKLVHYSRELISRTDPSRWGDGLSRGVTSERNRKLSGAAGRTYFGIEQATENGYKKELGLGEHKLETTIDGELIYNPAKDPDKLWDNSDIVTSENAIAAAGYVGYYVNSKQIGKVVAVFDEIEVSKFGTMRESKAGDVIEAAINPETGELHINASAFRDEAHLMEVMREEIIGHYGLRKSLGGDFQGVINDIKTTAVNNPELRQMWTDLSGVDPQTKQVINPDAPYKGMADDVIADEIISKMAREELSETTLMAIKNIIVKALRKIGLIKDDITINEMKALVMKSEKALKKNARKPATMTGLKTQAKASEDEVKTSEVLDAEATRIINDDTVVEGVVFDAEGNTINYRESLLESESELAGIESVRVCAI